MTAVQTLVSPTDLTKELGLKPTFVVRYSASVPSVNELTIDISFEIKDRFGNVVGDAAYYAVNNGTIQTIFQVEKVANAFFGFDYTITPRFAFPPRSRIRLIAEGG